MGGHQWRAVCVFGGSSSGIEPAYAAKAAELGQLLAEQNLAVVFGGGSVGMMGAVADAALNREGQVIGVIPDFLATKELLHTGITETIITRDMHSRKAKMSELSDAFIALPGGLGTFEELFEVLTWAQLGVHRKPIGLLNVNGFYDPLIELVDHAIRAGFIKPEHRDLFLWEEKADILLQQLKDKQMPDLPKWTDLSET